MTVRRVAWALLWVTVLASIGSRRPRSVLARVTEAVTGPTADAAAERAAQAVGDRLLTSVRRDRLVPDATDAAEAAVALRHALEDLATSVRRRERLVPDDPDLVAARDALRAAERVLARLAVAASAEWVGTDVRAAIDRVRDDLDVVRHGVLPTALGHDARRPLALPDPAAGVGAAVAVAADDLDALVAVLTSALAAG